MAKNTPHLKNTRSEKLGKRAVRLAYSTSYHAAFHFMCHWVSAAQTELKISGFLWQQQQMVQCGRDKEKKNNPKTFLTRVSCFVVTRKPAQLQKEKVFQQHDGREEYDSDGHVLDLRLTLRHKSLKRCREKAKRANQ